MDFNYQKEQTEMILHDTEPNFSNVNQISSMNVWIDSFNRKAATSIFGKIAQLFLHMHP